MDIRTALYVVAVLAAPLTELHAQPDTISLARAVALARQASPRIAGATAAVRAAGARIRPASTLPDPQLTLAAMNRSLSGMPDPMTMNTITLMQMVPVNGMLGLRRNIARFDSARVAAGRDGLALEVERDVRARYWELYHVQQALAVMDRTVAVLRELASVASAMYAVGTAAQADVLRAQTALTRMHQDIDEMRLMRVRAAAELNESMGRPAEAAVSLPIQDPEHAQHAALVPFDAPALEPVGILASYADSSSPELAAARAMQAAAGTSRTLANRMIYPDLNVGVAYQQRPGAFDNMISLMVGVSLPVYARGRQFRMRDEAAALSEQADAETATIRLALRSRILVAREEAETARRQLARVAGTLIPQAEASYEASLAAYRVGRADFAAALDARMALLAYQHDVHRYEAMYGVAVAELDRLIGRPFAASSAER